MKRAASAVVALAYCLAFLVVCLGTCLAASNEHGCCEKAEGFTLADAGASKDCCRVTSGVCSKLTTSATAALDAATWLPQFVTSRPALALPVSTVPVASSPPLILRI